MTDLTGKTAFITGGASGIGLALGGACARQGMNVMLADIDDGALHTSAADLADAGLELATTVCDVADSEALKAAAELTANRFGEVHMLFNNAGVFFTGGAGETSLERWRWAVDVNFMSVVYGVEAFLPLLRRHGEGGHIVNTASVAGHVGFAGTAAYAATKHAVVGYSESIAAQLQGEGIKVSVLCPGFVNTRIAETERYGEDDADYSAVTAAVRSGMSADVVAEFTLEQALAGAMFIFTHPGTRGEVEARFPRISAAFDQTEASELINSDPDAQRVATKEGIEDLHR